MNALHASRLGRYITTMAFDERVQAYVPPPLPPVPSAQLGCANVPG